MRFFEEMALSTALSLRLPVPLLWVRYVDDVLVLLPCREDFDTLLTFLNSLRSSICFTLELESDGHLPFLDMVIQRSEGSVVFDVYRKPTHTDKYLNRDSCHPPQVFKGLVAGLKKRAVTVCSSSKVSSELRHVRDTLSKNGYSQKDLSQLLSRKMNSRPRPVENKRAVVPYIPGLSHKVSRCFKKAGLEVSFKPPPTLRSFLFKKKPKQIVRHGFVYRIPCSTCSWSYVGETGRTLKERLTEHKRAVSQFVTSSEVANHVLETGHVMDWDKAECLSHESSYSRRLFKEAWFSRVYESGNRVFHDLDAAWNTLVPNT